jgi:hypothetical protein
MGQCFFNLCNLVVSNWRQQSRLRFRNLLIEASQQPE